LPEIELSEQKRLCLKADTVLPELSNKRYSVQYATTSVSKPHKTVLTSLTFPLRVAKNLKFSPNPSGTHLALVSTSRDTSSVRNLKGRLKMKLLGKHKWLFRILALAIALGGAAAIWAVPKFLKRTVTIKSQVTTYLLDEKGNVNGLLLASGDQLHFRSETGATVVQRIPIGSEVTVVGHAGNQTNLGREIKVQQITANGHTIQETKAPPSHPKGPKKHHGPKDRQEPDSRTDTDASVTSAAQSPDGQVTQQAAEILKVTGTVKTHLVNGHGDVDGVIFWTGEQVRLSPKVGKLLVAAEQAGNWEITIEGRAVRTERGIVIRPGSVTAGNQTITLAND
jgi:hypothetical protein